MTIPWSQLLLAFLFIAIGFVGGVLVTFTWIDRQRQAVNKEQDNQPVNKVKTEININPSQVELRLQSIITPPKSEPSQNSPEQNAVPLVVGQVPTDQKKIEESISIVSQIDEILQEMIQQKGLGARGIRLKEDTRQGVVVWIGLDRFVGIDAVSDNEVRSIIRDAVSEWERKTEKIGK